MLRRLLHDTRGTAAIQMAILIPVLVFGGFGMVDTWSLISNAINMRAGVNAAVKLAMQGETDDTALQSVALAGWAGRPSDAAVNVGQSCQCSGLVVACTSLCYGSKAPDILISIKASGTWKAPFQVQGIAIQRDMVNEQVLRVR